jgi:nitrite reductase/ring-hydroxylating ferredoxin subunit
MRSLERCVGCRGGLERREFLRDIVGLVAGFTGILPVGFASALSVLGEEVTYAIPGGDGVTIDKDREVILTRHEQSVYAFALSCPHQKTPLRWQEAVHRFQCPKHKSAFQPDGVFIEGRATRNMDRHAIRREGDNVVVDLGTLFREDENRDAWLAAVVRV